MRRILDMLAGVLLTAFLLHLLVAMVAPYAPYIIIAVFIFVIGGSIVRRQRYW